jgi:carbon monoxide dehydrogenase subunit G
VSETQKVDSDIASVYGFFADCDRVGELLRQARHLHEMPDGPEMESVKQVFGRIEEIRTTSDTCMFVVPGIGDVGIRVEERVEPTLVKFTSEGALPFEFQLWIQLLEHAPYDTRMRLTFEASLNMMMKMMLKGKLEKLINHLADRLARLPYPSMK